MYLAEDWASDPVQRALVPLEPVRDEEAEDEGETEDEQVAGGVEVDELRFDTKKCTIKLEKYLKKADLEVGQANGGDDAEHDAEDPPDDGRGDGDEEGAELGEEAEDHHGQGGGLDDSPGANLGEVSSTIFFLKKNLLLNELR